MVRISNKKNPEDKPSNATKVWIPTLNPNYCKFADNEKFINFELILSKIFHLSFLTTLVSLSSDLG